MRIQGFHINGFGIFHDVGVEALPPGLTVFLGDNESGKSTLLGFLRAMLLGFPDRRSREKPYPPFAGGQHGGTMTLVAEDGKAYVVERGPGPRGGKVDVLNPDGTRGKGDLFHRLLGPAAGGTLFKNIYAFSLTELQSFETLNTESLREALYSAAGGVDPVVLGNLRARLAKEEGGLFKPGGRKPRINTLLFRLSTIRREKRALSSPTEAYDRLQLQIADLRREIQELEEKRMEGAFALGRTEKWLQVWPLWVRLSGARERLAKLEPIERFPMNGPHRFEELKRRLRDSGEELLNKQDDLKRQEKALSELPFDPRILKQSALMTRLQRDQGRFEAVGRELVSLEQERSGAVERLKEDLRRIGRSWTEGKVCEFDLSVAVREEVRIFRERLEQAQRVEEKRREYLEGLRSKTREAEQVLNYLPEPVRKYHDHLGRMQEACRRLRDLLSRQPLLKHELRHLTGRMDDIRQEREAFQEEQAAGPHGLRAGRLAGIILLGAAFLAWTALRQDWAGAIAVASLFCVVIVIGLVLARTRKGADVSRLRRHMGRLDDRERGLRNQQEEKKRKLGEIEAQAGSLAAELSLPDVPTMDMLERVEQEVAEKIRIAGRRKDLGKDLDQLEQKIAEGLEELNAAVSEREGIEEDWRAWLHQRNLDSGLTMDGALEVLSLIASCREQAARLEQVMKKITHLEQTRDEYVELANGVLSCCGKDKARADKIPVAVHELLQAFTKAAQAEQRRRVLLEEIASSRASVERLEKQTAGLKKEMQALIHSGGADGEEAFLRRAQIYDARAALLKEIVQYEENMKPLSGALGAMEDVQDTLSEMELEGLEKERIRLKRDQEETEASLDRARREEAKFEEQVRLLINDEQLSALREEEETLKEALGTLAEEWSILRFAQGLIRMARASYEKERQPEVIQRAGGYFKELTLGRYTSLVAPIGENRIEVLSRGQGKKEIAELSRGTAEQLYLSLRFGFIEEFCKRSEALPIIMDEILVNFDASRARAAARAMLALAGRHQILFFTCHPWAGRFFTREDPLTPIWHIHEGEVKEQGRVGLEMEV